MLKYVWQQLLHHQRSFRCYKISLSGGSSAVWTCSFTAMPFISSMLTTVQSSVEQRAAPQEHLGVYRIAQGYISAVSEWRECYSCIFVLFSPQTSWVHGCKWIPHEDAIICQIISHDRFLVFWFHWAEFSGVGGKKKMPSCIFTLQLEFNYWRWQLLSCLFVLPEEADLTFF